MFLLIYDKSYTYQISQAQLLNLNQEKEKRKKDSERFWRINNIQIPRKPDSSVNGHTTIENVKTTTTITRQIKNF